MVFWLKDDNPIKVSILLKIVFPELKKFEITKFIKKGKVLLNDEPVFSIDKMAGNGDEIKFHGKFIKLKRQQKEKEEEPTEFVKHNPSRKVIWNEFSESKILDTDIERLSLKLHNILLKSALTLTFAESCTGGLLQEIVSRNSGSSKFFLGGVVTYSIESKTKLLKVKKSTLKKFGAVSYETAREMVYGLQNLFVSDISVSVTGIAGPTGGTKEKPVGTVHFAVLFNDVLHHEKLSLKGKREAIRKKTAIAIIKKLIKLLTHKNGEDK